MPAQNDVLVNPTTRERVVFLETRESSDNEVLRMEVFGLAATAGNVVHIHPTQTETHRVLAGRMGVSIDGVESFLDPNESATFEMNVPHKFWNASGPDIHFITEFRPAFDTENLIETYFAIARKGLADAEGQPTRLNYFAILAEFPIGGYLPRVPIWFQRVSIRVLGFIARLFGYRGRHEYPRGETS